MKTSSKDFDDVSTYWIFYEKWRHWFPPVGTVLNLPFMMMTWNFYLIHLIFNLNLWQERSNTSQSHWEIGYFFDFPVKKSWKVLFYLHLARQKDPSQISKKDYPSDYPTQVDQNNFFNYGYSSFKHHFFPLLTNDPQFIGFRRKWKSRSSSDK